jgi:hypothetical protein
VSYSGLDGYIRIGTGLVRRKLRELFEAGCKMAWVIDPRKRSAQTYATAAKFKTPGATDVLDGGRALPGFKVPLADLSAATKRRKGKPKCYLLP